MLKSLQQRLNRGGASAAPSWLRTIGCAIALGGAFGVDARTGVGEGAWVLYLLPLIGTLWLPSPRAALRTAWIATALLLVGTVVGPAATVASPHAVAYRAIGTVVLWMTAGLITARKRSDATLQRAHDHLSHILAASPVVLYSLAIRDGALRPLWVSENFSRLTGYAPDAPFSFDWWLDRVHPDDVSRIGAGGDVLAHEHATDEYRFRRADGSYLWVRNEARILRDAAGEPIEMIGSWADVTDRRRAEDAVAQARDQLSRVLSSSPVVTYSLAIAGGRVVSIWNSDNITAVTGYPREQTLSLHWWLAHIHPEDRPSGDDLAATLRDEHLVREFRFHCADGTWRWIRDESRLVRDARGEPSEIVGAWADITEQKRAAEAVRVSERRQQEEAEVSAALARVGKELMTALGTPDFLDRLCAVTAQVLRCHASHTLMWRPNEDVYVPVAGYGMSPEQEAIARLIKVPRQLMAELLARLEDADVGHVGTIPTALLSAADQERLGLTTTLCMALRRGTTLIGVQVVLARDTAEPFRPLDWRIAHGIAQLASVALEHARVVEELNQASRLKSEFVATMSHELRTPINIIAGYADLLMGEEFGALNADQLDAVRKMNRSARELFELINATLDLGRFEAGQVPLVLQDVVLGDVLAEVRAETRAISEKPQLAVSWICAPDLPPLHSDRMKVKTVVKNLVNNAVKFTDRGQVTVTAAAADDGIAIAVTDSGIGIAPDVLPIIFEPFRQADSSTTRRHGGVGLGLYIVRRFVDLLGGTVTVESELGRGSTFRVWIPSHGHGARAAA
jgi:PAS domain S-box-containing protein